MAAFPPIYVHGTLVHSPIVGELENELAQNPTIRNDFDAAYVRTRARFTRLTQRWSIRYSGVSKANKNLIKAHVAAQLAGSNSFAWLNPDDSVTYTVRYLGLPKYTPWPNTNFLQYNIEFALEQV